MLFNKRATFQLKQTGEDGSFNHIVKQLENEK